MDKRIKPVDNENRATGAERKGMEERLSTETKTFRSRSKYLRENE